MIDVGRRLRVAASLFKKINNSFLKAKNFLSQRRAVDLRDIKVEAINQRVGLVRKNMFK